MTDFGSAANYHVLSIIETCTRLGLGRRELLAHAGITETELNNPCYRQPGEKVLKLWQSAEALSGNVLVPFHVGSTATSLHRSAVTIMIEACPTLGQALMQGIRYQHLTQSIVSLQLFYDQDYVCLRVNRNGHDPDLVRPQVERQIAFVVAVAKNLAADHEHLLAQVQAEFSSEPRTAEADYEQLLGLPIRFRGACDQLIFPKSIMETENFSASGEVQSSLLAVVQQQERALRLGDNILAHLRQLIADSMGHETIEIEGMAAKLNLSVRTLQRRLKAQNTHFSEVYDEVRNKKAIEMIECVNLSLEEISYQLGFSHITGFYSAFRRWTGYAPKQYRQTLIPDSTAIGNHVKPASDQAI